MEFHEDVIFKSQGQEYGQELIEIIKIKGKIVKVHQTEYGIIDPKMYKPGMVLELEDKIVILEFQRRMWTSQTKGDSGFTVHFLIKFKTNPKRTLKFMS